MVVCGRQEIGFEGYVSESCDLDCFEVPACICPHLSVPIHTRTCICTYIHTFIHHTDTDTDKPLLTQFKVTQI